MPEAASAGRDSFDTRISRGLIRWRWPLLVVGAIVALVCYGPSQRLSFDRSVENMFAPDDPVLVPYRQLKRTFVGNEIALAAYVDPQLLTAEGLARVDELTTAMQAVPGVHSVLSLTTTPLGTELYDSPLRDGFIELFEGYTIGADRQTTAVVCTLKPEDQTDARRNVTVGQLREIIERHDPTGVLTGEPVMVVDGFRYLEEDGTLLGRTATILLTLTIVIFFRSLRWVVVPMAVVILTLWMTKAILTSGSLQLSMVSSMLWAIVTATGIAMVMHIIVRFRELRDTGVSPSAALLACGTAMATPIAWTCVTDACGFGSLLFAHVGPVHDFGVMMVISSILVLGSTMLLLPGMALGGSVDADPKRAWGEDRLDTGLQQVASSLEHWPITVGALAVLFVTVCSMGIAWLDVETDFTKNFRASSPVVKSYAFVETNLGGAGVLDVFLPAPEEFDNAFLERIRTLEDRLRNEVLVENAAGETVPGLTKVLSLVDAIDALPLGELAKLMPAQALVNQFRSQMPSVMEALVGEDPDAPGTKVYRIMLRARERQPSAQKNRLIEQVGQISREEFPEAQVTGFFILLTQLIDSMIRDQWFTFMIACIAIGVCMLVAFRSIPLAIAALVPNMMPILVVTGMMGWFGVRINMGAAMIAAVSMGLSVDSSIHYIASYLERRKQGASVTVAIEGAHQSVGRAMVFSTLALIVGFSALCLSQFVPLIYFGVLMCLAMAGGMIGNLVVLPLLLRLIARFQRDSTSGATPLMPSTVAPHDV